MTVPPVGLGRDARGFRRAHRGGPCFTKDADGTGLRAAAVLSGLWIAAGLAFGGVLWLCVRARLDPCGLRYHRDLFVVFTSNAFAVLGLRALYFLLAGSMDRFPYLEQGLAVLLVFIGAKMLISPFIHLPVTVSLAVIIVVVAGAVAASLWRDRARPRPPDEQKGPVHH